MLPCDRCWKFRSVTSDRLAFRSYWWQQRSLPLGTRPGDGANSASWKRTCKGRRASTLKSQGRYCGGFIAWLSLATGLWWPSSASDLVRYRETRAEEPCGRSVPGAIQRSLVFGEDASEGALCERIATRPAVLYLLEVLSTTLSPAVRSKRGACQVPMSLAIHWKDTV